MNLVCTVRRLAAILADLAVAALALGTAHTAAFAYSLIAAAAAIPGLRGK